MRKNKNHLPAFHPDHYMMQVVRENCMNRELAFAAGSFRMK
jgi:hypothetical protein